MNKTMKYITSTFIFIIMSAICTQAQCDFDNVNISASACYSLQEFSVDIDFTSDAPSAVGYNISANGASYGNYTYDDFPINVTGVDGNCFTDYLFVITDLADADCNTSGAVGVVCCDIDCSITINDVETVCTDNDEISIKIDVDLVGTFTDSLTLSSNDEYTITLATSEIQDSTLVIPSLGAVQNIMICEPNTDCCDTYIINNPCVCNITNVHTSVTDCDDDLMSYYLRLDFDVAQPASDTFVVGKPNNPLGRHAYNDLPVLIGPLTFDEQDGDIFILDTNDAFCFGFEEHETLDSCEAVQCNFTDINVIPSATCDADGNIMLTVDFDNDKESSGFLINVDGVVFGPFTYGEKDYTVGPLPANCSGDYLVEVVDVENMECSINTLVEGVCCDCELTDLTLLQYCNASTLDSVSIDFNFITPGSENFNLTINNTDYGTFLYDDLPLSVTILGSMDSELEILISDELGMCTISETIENECQTACAISGFEVEVINCQFDTLADLQFIFELDNFVDDSLELYYNDILLETYAADSSEAYNFSLFEVDCELDSYNFVISSQNDSDCFASFSLDAISCCDNCMIDSANVNVTCLDIDMQDVVLDFDYSGEMNDEFFVYLEDVVIASYTASELPVTISTQFPSGEYSLEVEFEFCVAEIPFTIDCTEPCVVENLIVDTIGCSEGAFMVEIDFDHSVDSDSFALIVNGSSEGNYFLDDLPITAGPYMGDGITSYEFIVSVFDMESCLGTFDLGAIDCPDVGTYDPMLENVNWWSTGSGISISNLSDFQSLRVINLQGQIISQQEIRTDQVDITIDQGSLGIYFIELQTLAGSKHTLKVII